MELAQEELQMGVEKEDYVTFLKLMTVNELIMPPLRSFLINSKTFIGIQMDFFKFVQLEQSYLPCRFQIEVQMLDGPVGLVF